MKKIMEQDIIELDDQDIFVFQIELDKGMLIILKTNKRYVMSDYLDINKANKLGEVAGKIRQVSTINEALNSKIIEVSNKALMHKLLPGMKAKDFLTKL